MNKSDIKSVKNRESRHTYNGNFSDLQTFGNFVNGKAYQNINSDNLNSYQNILYKRALYGIKFFNEEEIKTMHWQKKKRIIKVHKRAQRIINIWKQELTNMYTSLFFEKLFPNSPITKDIRKCEYTDDKYLSTLTFKELGIRKADIVTKLYQEGIFPKNFFDLDEA
jgi:hypothetical protein